MSCNQPSPQSSNIDHNLALGILIELQDLDLLETHRFYKLSGYAKTIIDGKMVLLHRLVHSRMTGRPLSEYARTDHVRHIDPNGLDCRRSNLFVKTCATANQCDLNRKLSAASKTGIHGVCWHKSTEQWQVRLKYLNKYIHLGLYDTLEQAARVACHCRATRAEVTCSDTPMNYEDMKALLQREAKTV